MDIQPPQAPSSRLPKMGPRLTFRFSDMKEAQASKFQLTNVGGGSTFLSTDVPQPPASKSQLTEVGGGLTFPPTDIPQPQAFRFRPNSVSDLCEACQKITLDGLGCSADMVPKLRWVEEYGAEYDLTKVHGYEYPHAVGDLDDLYRRCKLCALIRQV